MTDLPQHRVDDRKPRTKQSLAVEVAVSASIRARRRVHVPAHFARLERSGWNQFVGRRGRHRYAEFSG